MLIGLLLVNGEWSMVKTKGNEATRQQGKSKYSCKLLAVSCKPNTNTAARCKLQAKYSPKPKAESKYKYSRTLMY
jgi:hypothetical protein